MRVESSLVELISAGVIWPGNANECALGSAALHAHFEVAEIDSELPEHGLSCSAIHEFALADELPQKRWLAPLHILTVLLKSLYEKTPHEQTEKQPRRIIIWVGKACWPTPHLLEQVFGKFDRDWSGSCLFIDPPTADARLWSMQQVLQSPSVQAVVGDSSGFNFIASRRLQLAAGRGRALGLMVRPPWEMGKASAAQSRWRLTSCAEAADGPCWRLAALRVRGLMRELDWTVRWSNPRTGTAGLQLVSAPAAAPRLRAGVRF